MYLWTIYIFQQSVCLFCYRKICGPTMGIYKSLADTWMWELVLSTIPRKGIHKWDFRCSVWHDYRSPTRLALEMCQWETIVLMYKNLPNLTMTPSLRLEAILHITDGWSKLDFVWEILVRPRPINATSTSSQYPWVAWGGRFYQFKTAFNPPAIRECRLCLSTHGITSSWKEDMTKKIVVV